MTSDQDDIDATAQSGEGTGDRPDPQRFPPPPLPEQERMVEALLFASAEPVGLRGDLFGLAGLVLMPLIGLAVGYRQAKAARDITRSGTTAADAARPPQPGRD